MRRILLPALAACLTLVAATATACSGGSSTSPATVPGGGTHQLDERANGTTVHVSLGDTVVVTLHSTYWSFVPTDGLALQPVSTQTATGSACPHVPGSGCGTVTVTFNVGHVGTSTLRAHRSSCGEALRCTGSAGDWSVTVIAT
jgi:hypothetical protein